MTTDLDSTELWSFGLIQWDGRAFEAVRQVHKDDLPECLHQAVAPEIEKLRDAAIYLETLAGIKYTVARVNGTVRAKMPVLKVALEQYVQMMSRIHAASSRTRSPSYHLFVQDCLIRSRTK
jgi:hypothetical protein